MAMVIAVRLLLSLMLFCWKTRSLIIRTASIRRLRTFVSPIGAVADNAGIRPLPNVHPSLVALWKVSNVAIFEGIALHRAASEPVSVWLKQNQHPHIIPTILFSSTLAASISGIVLVAVSDTSVVRLTSVEYVGVLACPMADVLLLQEKLQTSINNVLNNHDNDQKRTASSAAATTSTDRPQRSVSNIAVEVEVEVVQSSESGTHQGLHLVRVSLIGSPVFTLHSPIPKASTSPRDSPIQQYATNSIVERLLAGCVVAKAPCVMDGKTPLLSLVAVEAWVEETDINDSNGSGLTSSPGLSPSSNPVAVAVAQEVPVKFTKYMRRENILHTRLTSHSQGQQDTTTTTESTTTTTAAPTTTTPTTMITTATATTTSAPTTTATAVTEATFMGLSLLIPADALRPRPSR